MTLKSASNARCSRAARHGHTDKKATAEIRQNGIGTRAYITRRVARKYSERSRLALTRKIQFARSSNGITNTDRIPMVQKPRMTKLEAISGSVTWRHP